MVISDEERLARIGELIHMAAVRWWAAIDAGAIPHPGEPREDSLRAPLPANDSERILHHLARVRHAAPLDFRLALGLSRATVQRRLAELLKAGRLVATGVTHGRSYSLPPSLNSAASGQTPLHGLPRVDKPAPRASTRPSARAHRARHELKVSTQKLEATQEQDLDRRSND